MTSLKMSGLHLRPEQKHKHKHKRSLYWLTLVKMAGNKHKNIKTLRPSYVYANPMHIIMLMLMSCDNKFLGRLRTVPTFVNAHMFCASRKH